MNNKTFSIHIIYGLILVSMLLLSACSALGSAPVVMAQPDYSNEEISRFWEIDTDDIAAARKAAEILSQVYASYKVDLEGEVAEPGPLLE